MNPKNLTTEQLKDKLKELNHAYYNQGVSLVPDCEYDALVAELQVREPDSELVNCLGNDARPGKNTFIHPKKILSLDKIHEGDDDSGRDTLDQWVNGREVIIQPKYDGLTLVLYFKKGTLERGVTRGNGTVGEVIPPDRVLRLLSDKFLSTINPFTGTIRGEVVVPHDCEEKALALGYSNLRSCAVGQLRNNKLNPSDLLIEFIPFDMDGKTENGWVDRVFQAFFFHQGQKHPYLQMKMEPGTPARDIIQQADRMLDGCPYPTDGFVVKLNNTKDIAEAGDPTAHHPKDAIAFKFNPKGKETIIRNITWQVGRTGVLTPVAEFDAINLDGSTVTRATLSNYSNARYYNVGDVVEVVKAGEIIPFIRKITHQRYQDTQPPEACPECGYHLMIQKGKDADNLACTNPMCRGKMVANLVYACGKNALDIDGMGPAVARAIVTRFEEYVDSSVDLCAEPPEDARHPWLPLMIGYYDNWIAELPGTKRLLECLDKRRKDAKLEQWIAAMGIPYVGKTRATDLSWRYSSLSAFLTLFPEDLEKGNVEGFGDMMTKDIRNWMKESTTWDTTFLSLLQGEIPDVKGNLPENQSLKGVNFVITGNLFLPRHAYALLVKRMGGSVKENISRKTNYLVIGNKPGERKRKLAKLFNVPTLTEAEFSQMLQPVTTSENDS